MGPHKKRRKRSTSASDDGADDKKHRKSKKQLESTKNKRKQVSSSSSSTSSSSSSFSSTDSEEERRLREKKKLKRLQKQKRKTDSVEDQSADIPLDLMARSKAMAPMTKEEWEKRQNVVRRVYDESTGRNRLIKGDGEVIEEIVSRDRHKAINQATTRGDGEFFQSSVTDRLKK